MSNNEIINPVAIETTKDGMSTKISDSSIQDLKINSIATDGKNY